MHVKDCEIKSASGEASQSSTAQTQRQSHSNAFKTSNPVSNDAKLPRWFKPFGK